MSTTPTCTSLSFETTSRALDVDHVAQREVERVLLDVDRHPALEDAWEGVLDGAEGVAVAGAEAAVPGDLGVDAVDPGVEDVDDPVALVVEREHPGAEVLDLNEAPRAASSLRSALKIRRGYRPQRVA
jgi:hypothetical protein